ncbi:lipase maturation factor 2 [Copidosoma floridanum]|uniref:lipase maturation factor 2 n=1 Tax=Copidosoma floridanum TaxID=29053 RepID=UPI0006C98F87|nr:lipase maturation factor 2 [Copidosoma floridanum]
MAATTSTVSLPSVRYTRNLLLRSMCIIYMFAFLSFYVQIPGLYGDNGVLPAKAQLDLNSPAPLLLKFKQKPTLLWFAPYLGLNVEYMMDVFALTGALLAFLGFVKQKFCKLPMFVLLYSLYLSLYQVGQVFMWFQWDELLLEAGILCIVLTMSWSKKVTPTDPVSLWLVRWLLFRVMFSTGAVKLISKCPVWWNLDAMGVYFESQVIPTPLAWYAHHLPAWYLRLNTVFTNVVELVIPFLFFFPIRRIRFIAFYLHVFLQAITIITGNYNFYNLLAICLSISLLDDQFFYHRKSKTESSQIWKYLTNLICLAVYGGILFGTYKLFNLELKDDWTISSKIGFTQKEFDKAISIVVPASVCVAIASLGIAISYSVVNSLFSVKDTSKKVKLFVKTVIINAVVIYIFALSIVPYTTSLYPKLNSTLPIQLKTQYKKMEPFHVVNSYGLFRKMTGVNGRPEIIIEGSNSIEGPWKEYQFLYKPGNGNNSLPFVAPHQPRLDWQMWFAALGNYHQNPWLMSLAYRILNAQPEVMALLNEVENPFKHSPPKYVRASLFNYHYTPEKNKQSEQAWWTRERASEYFPIFSKDHPPLIEYLQKMKIIQDKPAPKVTNTVLKNALDTLRSVVRKFEATLLLWGMFTAGCAIIMTV